MKLKFFRIISSICFFLLTCFAIFLTVNNILLSSLGKRESEAFLLYLLGFLFGGFFAFFEGFFHLRAIKQGTMLIHSFAIKEGSRRRNPLSIIVSSILSALFLFILIFNVINYSQPSIQGVLDLMAKDFNIFYFLLLFINSIDFLIYTLFIVDEDFVLTK